jgi:4-hydroxybenzoyl-CoA thioesterase
MLSCRTQIRIQWGDCDPAGIVYFPRYFAFFDSATIALLETVGLKKAALLEKYAVAGFPVVHVEADFKGSCTFGDEVTIESTIERCGRASFDARHRLLKADGTLAVEFRETRVWVTRDGQGGIKAVAIPEEIKAHLEA